MSAQFPEFGGLTPWRGWRGDIGRCGSAPAFGRVEPIHRDGTAMSGAPAFGLAGGGGVWVADPL